MHAHSLELLLAAADDAWSAGEWGRLRAADLPSQADHTGASNRPHVTLVAAPQLGEDVLAAARAEVLPLLPLRVTAMPAAALGPAGRRGTLVLARRLVLPPSVASARDRLVTRLGGTQATLDGDRPWLPHLTLSRRLPEDLLPDALAALGPDGARERTVTIGSLRHWDPDHGRTTDWP